ncbi:MAG: FlgD immunoglobulin-like domain containing protein [Bacteroidota bacterium]
MMKYATLLFLAIVGSSIVLADVFASRTKVSNPDGAPFDGSLNDGTGVKISYFLNDTATSIEVKVIDVSGGGTVATINATDQGPSGNPNSVIWDGTGGAPGGNYYVTIATTGPTYSNTDYRSFYLQQTAAVGTITRGIYTRGLDVNSDVNSPNFGYWYASCADPGNNDGYRQGTLRYNPDGSFAGTEAGHPILLQTLGSANGGTFNWGTAAAWTAALDHQGRIYQVSNSGNFVTRMDSDTSVPKIIISNITTPRGVYAHGTGADLRLYIAADTVVWRANIGNDDTLMTPLELVVSLGQYARDVIIDDAGHLLVTVRTGELTAPGYIERYDISGTLPKMRSDANLQVVSDLGLPVCFEIKRGTDLNSASDDTIFYAVRRASGSDTTTFGIHQLTHIDGFFELKQIYKNSDNPLSAGGNNRQDADIALDYAGNIIWFENGNEEIVMIAPPRAGSTVTHTVRAYDTVSVDAISSVGSSGNMPNTFVLNQNYPNPFNPSTMISYQIPADGRVSVVIYDVLGNAVSELYNGSANAGYNAVVWNATNAAGMKAASGMYLYRVTAELSDGRSFSDVKRMLLLK